MLLAPLSTLPQTYSTINHLIGYESLIISFLNFVMFLVFTALIFFNKGEDRIICVFLSMGNFASAFERWLFGEALISEDTMVDLVLREKIIILTGNLFFILSIVAILYIAYKRLIRYGPKNSENTETDSHNGDSGKNTRVR